MSVAFDIYAKSLSRSGFGLPMWCPEPSLETGEIRLGDVGIMRDGIFVCLFNTLVPADDPINARRGVPEGFEPIDSLHMNQTSSITQQLLYSSGIELIDGTSSGPQATYSIATPGLRFRCTARMGAVLVLGGPATCQITHSRRRIADYMRRHLSSWMAFAYHHLGLKVREQELLFISGTAKTTSWLNVAFSKGDSKGVLSIRRDGGELSGGGELRVSMSEATNSSVFARAGPASTPAAGSEELPANQCIFVNYFRVKKRAWRSVIIKAAAGAHQLDYPPDDDPSPLRTFNLESESTSESDLENDRQDALMDPFIAGSLASGPDSSHALAPTRVALVLPDAAYTSSELSEEREPWEHDQGPPQTRGSHPSTRAEVARVALATVPWASMPLKTSWICATTSPSSVTCKTLPSVKLEYVAPYSGSYCQHHERRTKFRLETLSPTAGMVAPVA